MHKIACVCLVMLAVSIPVTVASGVLYGFSQALDIYDLSGVFALFMVAGSAISFCEIVILARVCCM